MRGWLVGLLLAVVLIAVLGEELVRGAELLRVYRTLNTIEQVASQMIESDRLEPRLIRIHVKQLREIAPLAPGEFGIPLAIGSHYLLMGDGAEAVIWYERALAVEPRPEIYLNLGRALRLTGDEAGGRENQDKARRLSPHLDRLLK